MLTREVLANAGRTLAEIRADGPIEITSIEGWDVPTGRRRAQLLAVLAAGARPGAMYGDYTPWPVELEDRAAVGIAAWLVERHEKWPDSDPGGLFERVGLSAPKPGLVGRGAQASPRRRGRALVMGRAWAAALADETPADGIVLSELIPAAVALGLLIGLSCPKAADRPERDGDDWAFPAAVRDIRGVLEQWISAMVVDEAGGAEEAGGSGEGTAATILDLCLGAWAELTGGMVPAPPKRRAAPVTVDDGVDEQAIERSEPLVRFVLEVAERCAGGPVAGAEVLEFCGADDHALLSCVAALAIAGVTPGGREPLEHFDADPTRETLSATAFKLRGDASEDPLSLTRDVFEDFPISLSERAAVATTILDEAAAPVQTDEGFPHGRSEVVPAVTAVLCARRASGAWNERAARAIDDLHAQIEAALYGEPVGRENTRTADLAAGAALPGDLGGLASLAAEQYTGSWSIETVRALAHRI